MKQLLLSLLLACGLVGCQSPAKPETVKETPKAEKKAPVKKQAKKQAQKQAKKASQKNKKPGQYTDIQIIGKTNKSALSYKKGEEMIFTFRVDFGKSKPGKWFLAYTRRGDDNKTFRGKVPADTLLTVKTSLNKIGFVSVDVFLVNEKGVRVTCLDARKRKRPIAFFAGAAVQAEKLRDCGEPKDFDAFWATQKKRLSQVPFAGKVEKKLDKEYPNGFVYAVTIPAPGPRPATGYMSIPKNAKAKSLPVHISFIGYGSHRQKPLQNVARGKIFFQLNAHGQKLGQNAAYYKEFFQSIRSGKYSYAFDPEENKNPESCFFNGMVMRLLRTLEYLKSLPEWDGKNVIASGGSQGGLQTMWAAALDQDVTVALPSITWCCDLAGTAKAKRIHGRWRIKYVPALDYYDPVFMAKRITKADVTILRAGLGDYTCPPSGLAISYNNLATPRKTIRWYQGSDHGFVPANAEIVVWTTKKKK